MRNPIKETLALNKIDLEEFKGVKVYCNKFVSWYYVIIKIIISTFFTLVSFKNNNYNSGFFYVLNILSILILLSLFYDYFGMKIKNPIFILSKSKLFYLRTNTWYDVLEYEFDDIIVGRNNYSLTFRMRDKNNEVIFLEDNFQFDSNIFRLKHHIRYIQTIEKRKNYFNNKQNA